MKKLLERGLGLEHLPLKVIVTLLPGGLLSFYWPKHPSIGLGLGLSIGIILSQAIPPRKPVWLLLLWIAAAVILGFATAAFPHWSW